MEKLDLADGWHKAGAVGGTHFGVKVKDGKVVSLIKRVGSKRLEAAFADHKNAAFTNDKNGATPKWDLNRLSKITSRSPEDFFRYGFWPRASVHFPQDKTQLFVPFSEVPTGGLLLSFHRGHLVGVISDHDRPHGTFKEPIGSAKFWIDLVGWEKIEEGARKAMEAKTTTPAPAQSVLTIETKPAPKIEWVQLSQHSTYVVRLVDGTVDALDVGGPDAKERLERGAFEKASLLGIQRQMLQDHQARWGLTAKEIREKGNAAPIPVGICSDGWYQLPDATGSCNSMLWAFAKSGVVHAIFSSRDEPTIPVETARSSTMVWLEVLGGEQAFRERFSKAVAQKKAQTKTGPNFYPFLVDGWYKIGKTPENQSQDFWVKIVAGKIVGGWYNHDTDPEPQNTNSGHKMYAEGTRIDWARPVLLALMNEQTSTSLPSGWYTLPGQYSWCGRKQPVQVCIRDQHICAINGGSSQTSIKSIDASPHIWQEVSNGWLNSEDFANLDRVKKELLLGLEKKLEELVSPNELDAQVDRILKATHGQKSAETTEPKPPSEPQAGIGLGTAAGAAALLIFGSSLLKKVAEKRAKKTEKEAVCRGN